MATSADSLFALLSEPRVRRESPARIARALGRLARSASRDPETLIRLHERLLFLLAYPPSLASRGRAAAFLERIPGMVERLEAEGADLSPFDDPESAGIAATTVTTEFSFDKSRWLEKRFPGHVGIDWDAADQPDRLGAALPRFVPLLEEEALADANVDYRGWLSAARGRGRGDFAWLLERFASMPEGPRRRAEIFNALALPVEWRLGRLRQSRTFLRRPARSVFLHREKLLSRGEVSLEAELASAPLKVRRLSRLEAGAMLDMARASTAARYREFYGFTYGDPSAGWAARVGRGAEIFLFGTQPDWRLPLRACYTAIVLKNGVPAAYYEGLCLFERMEAGFNVYYTFREGESAWIYAKVLTFCRQMLGVTSFSIDPYQIGFENAEAIESGAFWFYRKLGFRPTSPRVAALVAREEARLAAEPGYRTSARTLSRIATCNLLYEAAPPRGEWDRFHVRNLGLAVNRRMSREFGGDARALRKASVGRVCRALSLDPTSWPAARRETLENLAPALAAIPDLPRWTREEKEALLGIIRAKGGSDERAYLARMRRHRRLRRAWIALGSRRK